MRLAVTFKQEVTYGDFQVNPCSHRLPGREECGYTCPSVRCPVHCGCTAPPDIPAQNESTNTETDDNKVLAH